MTRNQPLDPNVKGATIATTVQSAHMPSSAIDPNLQAIMDSLQLADSNVYRILKGEIHELMDKQGQILVTLQQTIEDFKDQHAAMAEKEANLWLAKIHNVLVDLGKTNDEIALELQQYFKMIPYLLMLSPLMWLSNLSAKQVRDTMFMQSIMVQRDRCLRDDDCEGFDDDNILDAIEILMHVMVAGSEKGWKSNVIRNEVKEVKTVVEDHTAPNERRKGVFGKLGL